MKTHEDIKISFLYLEIVDVTNKDANFGRLNCPDPQDNLCTNLILTIPPPPPLPIFIYQAQQKKLRDIQQERKGTIF